MKNRPVNLKGVSSVTIKQAMLKLKKYDSKTKWYLEQNKCHKNNRSNKRSCTCFEHPRNCPTGINYCQIGKIYSEKGFPITFNRVMATANNWEDAVNMIVH